MSDLDEIRSYLAQSVLPILVREPFFPVLVAPSFPWWGYPRDVFRVFPGFGIQTRRQG